MVHICIVVCRVYALCVTHMYCYVLHICIVVCYIYVFIRVTYVYRCVLHICIVMCYNMYLCVTYMCCCALHICIRCVLHIIGDSQFIVW